MCMRIGLMGGTFDPIHFGHLYIAEETRVYCGLEKVVFVPNNQPAQRDGKTASAGAEARFEMTKLAIADNPYFEISRVEVDRPGPSYLFDTLSHFREELGPGSEMHFIMGADSMRDLPTWYRSAELFELCRFVAAARPGFDLKQIAERFTAQQRERIKFLEMPGLHIASSDLRMRVQNGWPIRYLVPDIVERAIAERGLYRG